MNSNKVLSDILVVMGEIKTKLGAEVVQISSTHDALSIYVICKDGFEYGKAFSHTVIKTANFNILSVFIGYARIARFEHKKLNAGE